MAMGSVIAVNVWKGIPFFTLLLLAGLKAIDNEQLEAAEVDGANAVQRFRHVTLPGLRYVIIVVLLLSFISTFNQFGLIFLMTGGGPGGATKLYSILAYEKAIGSLQYGPGSAIALSVAPLMAVLIWLLARFMRHDERAAARGARAGASADRIAEAQRPRLRRSCSTSSSCRSTCCSAASRRSAGSFASASTGFADEPVFKQTQRARDGRASAAPARAAADHGLRAVPVLLGDRHLVQIDAADQRADLDLLAPAVHARAVPVAAVHDTPFLIWLRQLGARRARSAR